METQHSNTPALQHPTPSCSTTTIDHDLDPPIKNLNSRQKHDRARRGSSVIRSLRKGVELDMATVDRDWIKKQIEKGISAEQSVIRAEKDHRDKMKFSDISNVYDMIIQDDESHVDSLKAIASSYGAEEHGSMESAGGLLGSLKSAVESVGAADPFQTIGDDMMLKSNAINYDLAWQEIFSAIGDDESASLMSQAASDDKKHHKMMLDLLTNIGMDEAQGREVKERAA